MAPSHCCTRLTSRFMNNRLQKGLLLVTLTLCICQQSLSSEHSNKISSSRSAHTSTNSGRFKSRPQVSARSEHSIQKPLTRDEYENLAKEEVQAIKSNQKSIRQTEAVVPSTDTNGNSQVVFVNLERVVNDGGKNDSIRQIGSNEQLIKQDGQIACGETNRNGKPSMDAPAPEALPNRIVGGTKAEPGEFPFQVRLNIRSRRGSSLCGGVIIDQRHILTAAHCMTTW